MPRVSLSDPTFTFDPADPEGFRAGLWRVGPQLGAQRTGASLYELPPGQAVCPYHYEYGEEEWALVLDGRPTLRTPEGVERLERPSTSSSSPAAPRAPISCATTATARSACCCSRTSSSRRRPPTPTATRWGSSPATPPRTS